jgi:dihydrolipoamide dehydrogenase
VTLVEMLPEILPMVDADVARVVKLSMKNLGIKVMTKAKMSDIKSTGKTVTATAGGEKLRADQLLVCVGRVPCTNGLDLASAGLETDETGHLKVNEKCRTNVPGIYAIGDITGVIQYAHRASAMGICAANNATGQADTYSDNVVPGCIFTKPQIGAVGITEAEAKEQGMAVKVGKFPFIALGKAQVLGETDGFCKIIADSATDQVLGAHIVGPHATDLIAEVATGMTFEITAAELGQAIHAHPTLAEAAMEAAHAVHEQCIHLPKPRKRGKK